MNKAIVPCVLLIAIASAASPATRLAAPATAPTTQPSWPADLGQALDAVLTGELPLDSVSVIVAWNQRTLRLDGSGIGVFGEDTQITLTKEQVIAILKLFQTHGFAQMHYPRNNGLVLGRVSLTIGRAHKLLFEPTDAEPPKGLPTLAEAVLKAAEPAATQGVKIGNFRDGMEKLGKKTLSPLVLRISLRRTFNDKLRERSSVEMSLMDGTVTAWQFSERDGSFKSARLRLTAAEMDRVARLLIDNEAADLPTVPKELHADIATRLELWVMHRHVSVAATPAAEGEAEGSQKKFDRIYEGLRALCDRTLKEGQPDSPPATQPR